MTPKEKAEELINNLYEIHCKFLKADTTLVRYARYNTLMPICIESAILAVDEILNHETSFHSVLDGATDYWQDVKSEIEKQNTN